MMDETRTADTLIPTDSSFMPPDELLRVNRLHVARSGVSPVNVYSEPISFSIRAREIFALTGRSGSGKTTLACAMMKLLPSDRFHVEGSVLFGRNDLLAAESETRRVLLRSTIRYVFQEPGQSFNPIARIGTQVGFMTDGSEEANERFHALLTSFGLSEHRRLLRSYPHELSIGTLQRIMIAAAAAPRPSLLIADEPTSAVDFVLKHAIMERLCALCREGMSVLFITHDLPLARRYAHRIARLSDGRLTEER